MYPAELRITDITASSTQGTGACVEKLDIAEKKHHPMKNQQGRSPSCPLARFNRYFLT
jgi:hypothetical protein